MQGRRQALYLLRYPAWPLINADGLLAGGAPIAAVAAINTNSNSIATPFLASKQSETLIDYVMHFKWQAFTM